MNSSTSASSISTRRTSQPWTGADNAAGFVLRYLLPMRELLIQGLGGELLADESLKRLISHLMAQGFGANGKGRIRDFLLRGIRSAAKSVVNDLPEAKRPAVDFNQWVLDLPAWIAIWRKGLLTRAWRGLERIEHKNPATPFYTILRAATEHPQEDVTMLAVRVNTKLTQAIEPAVIQSQLQEARGIFSSLLEHEVAETLDTVDPASVMQEIEVLGLASVFVGSNAS